MTDKIPTKVVLHVSIEAFNYTSLKEHWKSITGRISNCWPVQKQTYELHTTASSPLGTAGAVLGRGWLMGEAYLRPGITAGTLALAVMKSTSDIARTRGCSGTLCIEIFKEGGGGKPSISLNRKLGKELYDTTDGWKWASLKEVVANRSANQHKGAHSLPLS